MQALVVMMLVLVPAPKEKQLPANPIVGAWCISWGEIKQTTFFREDGTCWSPEFNAGTWFRHEEIIWFTEQNGTTHFGMCIDWLEGTGHGWRIDPHDGEICGRVDVRIRRGERLPMPREVK